MPRRQNCKAEAFFLISWSIAKVSIVSGNDFDLKLWRSSFCLKINFNLNFFSTAKFASLMKHGLDSLSLLLIGNLKNDGLTYLRNILSFGNQIQGVLKRNSMKNLNLENLRSTWISQGESWRIAMKRENKVQVNNNVIREEKNLDCNLYSSSLAWICHKGIKALICKLDLLQLTILEIDISTVPSM